MCLLEKIVATLVITLLFILLTALVMRFADWLFWLSCKEQYVDSQYGIYKWCMIKYRWQYIPEELYEKAFEQNNNILIKK